MADDKQVKKLVRAQPGGVQRELVGVSRDMQAYQDDCLIAITRGHPVPADKLAQLPPWRAVLVARIADKARVPLERGTLGQLVAEAVAVGGDGTLGPWWERPADEEG